MSTRTAYRCRACGWIALADGYCPRCGEFALVPVALVTVETINKGTAEAAEREAK